MIDEPSNITAADIVDTTGTEVAANIPAADTADTTGTEAASDDLLRLENQLCFPLYAASRLMMQIYKPHLDRIGLTYPQYLVMMVLWAEDGVSVKTIGQRLHLDSATLTQVLGNLERMGLIQRRRERQDARTVINKLTAKGRTLKKRALRVPVQMSCEFADRLPELTALRPLLQELVQILNKVVQK